MSYSEKEIREAGNFRFHIASYISRLASIHPKVCCCMDPRCPCALFSILTEEYRVVGTENFLCREFWHFLVQVCDCYDIALKFLFCVVNAFDQMM